MDIVIHHNPDCSKSREVLGIIEAAGYQPTVIEYLEAGWTRPQLLALFAAAGLIPRTALRASRSPAGELGLLDETVADEALLDAMLEHPVLVEPDAPLSARTRACASVAHLRRCLTCWTIGHRDRSPRRTGNWSSTQKATALAEGGVHASSAALPCIGSVLQPGAICLRPPEKAGTARRATCGNEP